MRRDQLLVGRAHADALFKRLFGKSKGGLLAAHGLADHADLRVVQDDIIVVHDPVRIGTAGKFPQVEDVLDFYTFGHSARNRRPVDVKELDHAATNCSKTQHSSFYHLFAIPFLTIFLQDPGDITQVPDDIAQIPDLFHPVIPCAFC